MATIDAGAIKEINDEVQVTRGNIVWKMCKAMIARRKEIAFIIAITVTAYAAIQTSPLRTRKAAFPSPFFPSNSLVVDYFWGDVVHAFEAVQYSDVTFIMFYAPWDAESMDVRWEFEKTAKFYHSQVKFAAVNCWWPNGECKQHFPKIRSFPLLIAYHSNGKGIVFHGSPTLPYMTQFLNEFIRPIKVIHDQSDLYNLMAKRDAVVVGFFDFAMSYMPAGFLTFYTTSLKALERDPEHQTTFAVVSNHKDALKFGLNVSGSINMHLWNGKMTYNGSETLSSQKLLNWVVNKKSQVLKWLTLPHVKSHRLSYYLEDQGPTLVLLTPRFVSSELDWSPYYYMLKEVALDYFNCNNSSHIKLTSSAIATHLKNGSFSDGILKKNCKLIRRSECTMGYITECCVSVLHIQSTSKKFSVCAVGAGNFPEKHLCKILKREISCTRQWKHSGCRTSMFEYSPYHYLRVCCYEHSSEIRSHSVIYSNPIISKCDLIRHSDVHPGLFLPKESLFRNKLPITSHGCLTNRTLNFVAIDSLRSGFLFEKIGIKLSEIASRTAVAIIHAKHEIYFVLKKELTVWNLREFIWKFSQNELQRYRLSSTQEKLSSSSNDKMAVIEVTSSSFDEIVMNNSKDVVSLVYAPWCASCFSVNHVYLSVARYLQSCENIIFTRINGEANDLPWEFSVQKYPTVIIFPGSRKSESAIFPFEMAITAKNLIHFILAHADAKVRIHAVLAFCSNLCITHNRKLVFNKISNLLEEYRLLHGKLDWNVRAIEEQCANLTVPEMIPSYIQNAKFLANQLCGIRAKLFSANSLHLKLSTTKTSISKKHINEIISDYNALSQNYSESDCNEFSIDLNRKVDRCSHHVVKSLLLSDRNSL